jgi:hypothetical protein
MVEMLGLLEIWGDHYRVKVVVFLYVDRDRLVRAWLGEVVTGSTVTAENFFERIAGGNYENENTDSSL